ncbi:hypothetical protein JAAARDRAFT_429017 [Jaapia argillacea MUCL 33604]|uniref:Uncharacterized protein n=1 Tax=Jaapia argillacea MUCL 33604 TaxID=933084 RepID=A0A067PIB5_9AGAM|nr:hypothetical protein JAAARDRAFT_429017 [Jaapia argillacea MUCL 33604]
MDDSDDYFDDAIELDETTLAVLDQEESKFNLTQSIRPPSIPPPPKRQKTEQGWRHSPQPSGTTFGDLDDLPEISVRNDGTYGFRGSQTLVNTRHNSVAGVVVPPSRRSSFASATSNNAPPRLDIRLCHSTDPRLLGLKRPSIILRNRWRTKHRILSLRYCGSRLKS